MRRILALAATAGLVALTLTGCSAAAADTDCLVDSGPASELVTVGTDLDSAPTVSFPTPLKAQDTQRSTIVAGDGPRLRQGQMVVVKDSLYNGTSGQLITQSGYQGTNAKGISITLNDRTIPGLTEGLQCVTVGSRVAITIAPEDAFGPTGGNPQLGIGPQDTLVFVLDIEKAFLPAANGTPVPSQPGFPTITLAPNGRPGVTIPDNRKPPSTVETETLKRGQGPAVERGDTVTIHYTGVLWKDKSVFDSTWARHQPATVIAEDKSKVTQSATNFRSGVVAGLADALVGSHVGSQFVVIVPPDKGFGSQGGSTQGGTVPGDATLVYVVDVLGLGG